MKERLSFKKQKALTGLAGVGHPYQSVDIKYGGVVGEIGAPTWNTDNSWSISFIVKKVNGLTDNNPNCNWMWITLKKKFNTEDEAREFVKKNIVDIANKYTLHAL